MKTKILFIRMFVLSCMLFTLGFTVGSCSDDDDAVLQAGYGYAQFKLYKSGLAETKKTRASTNELNYLRDAQKMKIVLINQDDGTEVVQTVGLEAMGDDSEFGLRSEKLQLMAGTYQIVGFYLFKADGTAQELKQILSGEPYEKTIITVINGGLAVQDIHVKVVNRGIVKFTVTKNFLPSTRATLGEDYLFSDIKYINVTVQEQFTKKDTTFSNVSVEYTEKLDGNGTKISVAVSDSLFRLPAGKYKVKNYTTIKKNKSSLEYGEVNGADFEVSDNVTTEVKIPVNFSKTTGSIKDYLILKEIWEALKGPAIPEKNQKGWSYSGVTYPLGTNWDFNKDIDYTSQAILKATFLDKPIYFVTYEPYFGPITMQYLPNGGIQSLFSGYLIIKVNNGFMKVSQLIFQNQNYTSFEFIAKYPDLVNQVLQNGQL